MDRSPMPRSHSQQLKANGNVVALCVLAAAASLIAAPAGAVFCARDQVPAATLLFPYVVVATDGSGVPLPVGLTTVTMVTNTGPQARIVHNTVWDIAGTPRLEFDEILAGYDVLQINWRDFLNGRFDIFDTSKTAFTASPPSTRDPFEWGPDGRGQGGGLTTPENRNAITSGQCTTPPPYGNLSALGPTIRGLLTGVLFAREHAGCSSPSELRTDLSQFGNGLTASPIFFYATVDVVKACNTYFPNQQPYWDASLEESSNVLTGEAVFLDSSASVTYSLPAVHIEAAENRTVRGFYEEALPGGVRTYREPLATAFGLHYDNDPNASVTSQLAFWKNFDDLNDDDTVSDCGSYLYYAWDMDDRSLSRATDPETGLPTGGRDPNQLPFATQVVPLTNDYFDLPGHYGWMMLVLPPSYGSWADPNGDPVPDRYAAMMGWAATFTDISGARTALEATTLANAHCFPEQTLPALAIGSTTAPGLSGDPNADGVSNVSDIFYLINFLFAGGPPPK